MIQVRFDIQLETCEEPFEATAVWYKNGRGSEVYRQVERPNQVEIHTNQKRKSVLTEYYDF